MKEKPIITVFTPTYNRIHTLSRTYKSLQHQNNHSFIWLIIDDGSTDNTSNVVKKWATEEKQFQIRYIYKENGGMHTAHNTAYQFIDTELSICIDSDDCLAEGAIDRIVEFWTKNNSNKYAGIIGLDADFKGNIIGTEFPESLHETTLTGYYSSGGRGDKKIVYRTDIIRKYPKYPVFSGENYVGLNYLYLLIDQDYKLLVLNEVLCNVDYQSDGSSATMLKQYKRNPKGFIALRKLYMEYPVSRKRLFIDCIHYVSSCIFDNDRNFIKKSRWKGYTIVAIPFGIILNLYIRFKTRNM